MYTKRMPLQHPAHFLLVAFATVVLFFCLFLTSIPVSAATIGAGATMPYPLFAKWASNYYKATGNIVNFQSLGSGGGIKQIRAETVDFGATEKPLSPDELKNFQLVQFPSLLGGITIAHSIKGVPSGALKLDGRTLANIYLGKIKYWNAPEIAKLNPTLKLPNSAIVVIRRSDGAGTTFLFSSYLSKVSDEWRNKIGAGTALKWPVGLGGKGNEGVAAYLQTLEGAIGYVEYSYAKRSGFPVVALKNEAGNFVTPGLESISSAASNASWSPKDGFYMVLVNQPGKYSWPIVGVTFILIRQNPPRINATREALKFFQWAFVNGKTDAVKLGYVPIPEDIVEKIQSMWRQEIPDLSTSQNRR